MINFFQLDNANLLQLTLKLLMYVLIYINEQLLPKLYFKLHFDCCFLPIKIVNAKKRPREFV